MVEYFVQNNVRNIIKKKWCKRYERIYGQIHRGACENRKDRSEEDAYNIARIKYNDEKVVLNADDLTDREIKVLKSGAGGYL